jgi:hypothetical protein
MMCDSRLIWQPAIVDKLLMVIEEKVLGKIRVAEKLIGEDTIP